MTQLDPVAVEAAVAALTPQALAEGEPVLREHVESGTANPDEQFAWIVMVALQRTRAALMALADEWDDIDPHPFGATGSTGRFRGMTVGGTIRHALNGTTPGDFAPLEGDG